MNIRRTKIVATVNSQKITEELARRLLGAGVDVVRLNFSHGAVGQHARAAALVRETARDLDRTVGLMVDLQGPKLRIERFKEGGIYLASGDRFILDAACAADAGDQERVGLAYKALPEELKAGDILLLDDGQITLEVKEVAGPEIICQVVSGGRLLDKKGINLKGGGLSAPALTDKDRQDIRASAAIEPDYYALSFVRGAEDVEEARRLIVATGSHAGIIAKIERSEALENIDAIIKLSDAIMIARGDLGVEITDPKLPGAQKMLIKKARDAHRVVITATQMMESMVDKPVPTRAEVFDVANAVLDGTDAVMLSAETASGRYPVDCVATMDRICQGAEAMHGARTSHHRVDGHFMRVDESIAMAAMYCANLYYGPFGDQPPEEPKIKAILALTESGQTALYMSRISSGMPIFALTPMVETLGKVTLYRGVYPIHFTTRAEEHNQVVRHAIECLRQARPGLLRSGDQVLVTKGSEMGKLGGTNILHIEEIP